MQNSIESPVFLVGSERSGTTLLRLMLDSHPKIAFNLESEYMVTQLVDGSTFPHMHEYIEFLRRDRVFAHSKFDIDESLSYVELMNHFLSQKKDRDNACYVGATIHYQFDKILHIWPRAKFIYLYRDPRDVANSVIGMGWAGNTYVASNWWLEADYDWEQLKPKLDNENIIEIAYEELLKNPIDTLNNLCHFFGTQYSERMFDYTNHSTYKYPDVKLAYQWKKKSSKRAVQLCEARLGARLSAKGYEMSTFKKLKLNRFDKKRLAFHSRMHCLTYRIQYFGFGLFLKELLARRLGLTQWQLKVEKTMNEISDSRLK